MVIPMSAPGLQLQGAPPPEAAEPMMRLKWSVLALLGFGGLRLLLATAMGILPMEFMSLLNVFLNAAMGAFLLRDDPHLERFYKCLSTTIFRMCAERGMGGLQCLMPFLACNAINLVFDFLSRSKLLGFGVYGLALAGNMAAEGAGAYFAWTVYKLCQDGSGGGTEMNAGSSDYVRTTDAGSAQSPASRPGGSEFEVFSGVGSRLGA